jgi:AdoMet-dependent heme synthase
MSILESALQKALALRVPLSVHFDLTYRCNERCEHCYLDHTDLGELSTSEVKKILNDLASSGVFFLSLSGGEPLVRSDLFEILEYCRSLAFNIKLKTNATRIGLAEAERLRHYSVEQVQVSVYSHRPEVHDAVTKLPGSLAKTLRGVRFLRGAGIKVVIANVLMAGNVGDSEGVHKLAEELGAHYTLDPTITPMLNGDTSVLKYRVPAKILDGIFHNERLVGNVTEFCSPPAPLDDNVLDGYSCSAGHTACYISPYGDVFPCVQFPLPCGNLRRENFKEVWINSPQLAEVRSIRGRHLTTCSSCTHLGSCSRCPGLAYLEGNMRGPSSADCEKSFVRTGIPSAGTRGNSCSSPASHTQSLIQIVSSFRPLPGTQDQTEIRTVAQT